MAKAFFRFLRGELNGYYLTNLNNALNVSTEDIKTFLAKFKAQQFNPNEIESDYAYNLGRFAGVSIRRTSRTDSAISIRMTSSFLLADKEVSEKGLFNTVDENFDWSNADYDGDMNDKATATRRSAFAGSEEPLGYISDKETDIFNEDETIKETAISKDPPEEGAYSDFYGNEFLMLADGTSTFASLNVNIYIELVKVMQIIRYNGEAIEPLCKIINIICGNGLIKIDHIETVDVNHFNVYYKYNDTIEIDHKQQRISLLDYLIQTKFPQANFVELI